MRPPFPNRSPARLRSAAENAKRPASLQTVSTFPVEPWGIEPQTSRVRLKSSSTNTTTCAVIRSPLRDSSSEKAGERWRMISAAVRCQRHGVETNRPGSATNAPGHQRRHPPMTLDSTAPCRPTTTALWPDPNRLRACAVIFDAVSAHADAIDSAEDLDAAVAGVLKRAGLDDVTYARAFNATMRRLRRFARKPPVVCTRRVPRVSRRRARRAVRPAARATSDPDPEPEPPSGRSSSSRGAS